MNKCIRCGNKKFRSMPHPLKQELDGHLFTATVPSKKCTQCGESYFDAEGGILFQQAIAQKLIDMGTSSGAAFKFLRKTLGIKASDLAPLLDVAAETISRWETGERAVDHAAMALLGVLVAEKLDGRSTTVNRLRSMRKPRGFAKNVRLALA